MTIAPWIIAYISTLIVFLVVDGIWIGVVAKNFYFSNLGELLRSPPNFAAAGLFYALYIVGIIIFAIAPALKDGSWTTALLMGALFGFFAYATYDMTNYATVKGWPLNVVVVDIVWGTVLTGACALGGYLATRALTGG